MKELFNNKYRISSSRLQNWNYGNEAMYFITICTKNRTNYFGKIVDSILQPTEIGKIAHSEWHKATELRPDMKLELGEFVVMPNHIHGIIIIGSNEFNPDPHRRDAMPCVSAPIGANFTGIIDTNSISHHPIQAMQNEITNVIPAHPRDAMQNEITNVAPAHPRDAMQNEKTVLIPKRPRDAMHCVSAEMEYENRFGGQSKNISAVVRGYKSAVTSFARKNNLEFDWQPRFHDIIFGSVGEYNRISNYILNNPSNWEKDQLKRLPLKLE
jgi:REP element-mobilizing transposase RayT